MSQKRVVVGKVSEIPPGERKIIVPFRGRAGIGVFNVNGTFHALRNICPHKQGPVCMGQTSGRTDAVAPPSIAGVELTFDDEGEVLICPWHFWPFEIASGECLVDPTIRIATFPIKIEGDDIIVDVNVKDFVEDE